MRVGKTRTRFGKTVVVAVCAVGMAAAAACGEVRVVDADGDPVSVEDTGDVALDDLNAGDVAEDAADGGDPADAGDAADAPDAATSTGDAADASADPDATSDTDAVDAEPTDANPDSAVDADAGDTGTSDAEADIAQDAAEIDSGPVACSAKSDCGGATPHCDPKAGKCVACLVAGHCPGEFARCANHQCLPPRVCSVDAECASDGGVCAPFGFCVDCLAAGTCPGGGVCTLFQCLAATPTCGQNSDCGGATPQCGTAGTCVACIGSLQCPAGELCSEGLCTPPFCSAGTTLCAGPASRLLCAEGGASWQTEPCATGQGCEGGVCKPWVCVPGQKACAGGLPTSCPANGSAWQVGKPCAVGELCIDGACAKAACQPGSALCSNDGKVQSCKPDGSGYDVSPCGAGAACYLGACKPLVCKGGTASCVGDALWLCNPSGTINALITDCAKSGAGGAGGHCAEGACAESPCTPGAAKCKGEKRLVCANDGKSWLLQACSGEADKCSVSACDATTKACKTGAQKTCDDGNPCNVDACVPATGECSHTPAPGACDDGDACTSGDACQGGACKAGPDLVVTFSGAKIPGMVDGPADKARFAQPYAVVARPDGTLVVADRSNHRLRAVALDGSVQTFAGTGSSGYLDGPAAKAMFSVPSGVAQGAGWIIVGDRNNHRVRRVSSQLQVDTLCGSGAAGDLDGKGAAAQLYLPEAVAIDAKGTVYVVEPNRNRLRRVTSDGTVTTLAGAPQQGAIDGVGAAARFNSPAGITLGPTGLLYVADTGNHRLRQVDAGGAVTTLCGASGPGALDGPAAQAKLSSPTDVLFRDGAVWILDVGNARLRRLNLGATPTVETLLGAKSDNGLVDGPADKATLQSPRGLFATAAGVGFAEQSNPCLRRLQSAQKVCDDGSPCTKDACVAQTGACSHVAGAPDAPCDDGDACTAGDACSAAGACAGKPKSCEDGNVCTFDGCDPWLGTCYQALTDSPCDDGQPCALGDHCQGGACQGGKGLLRTLIGSAQAGAADGTGAAAQLHGPHSIAGPFVADPQKAPAETPGVVYVSERDGNRLRRVDTKTWAVTTLAGSTSGFLDGAPAQARFASPRGMAWCSDKALYVADASNNRLRRVPLNAEGAATTVETAVGDGVAAMLDGPAKSARFHTPSDVACDAKGVLYVADLGNLRLRRLGTDGAVTTLCGSGVSGHLDGTSGVARFSSPTALLWRGDHLLVADRAGHRVRRVLLATGAVDTWLGSGQNAVEEGVGLLSSIAQPTALAHGPGGRVWIANLSGHILEARPSAKGPKLLRHTGQAGAGFADGALAIARCNQPSGLCMFGEDVLVADLPNQRLRQLTLVAPACDPGDGPCAVGSVCDTKTGACKTQQPASGAPCVAGSCQQGTCAAGICGEVKAVVCDDGKPCTADACATATGACTHIPIGDSEACCAPVPFADGFEVAGAPLETGAPSQTLLWQRQLGSETLPAKEGKAMLHYGRVGAEAFTALPSISTSYVRLAPVVLPKGTKLTLTAQVQFVVQPATTQNRIIISVRHALAAPQLAAFYANKPGWQTVSIDVSAFGGRSVQVEFFAQLMQGSAGTGIWLDEVAVSSTCKPKTCVSPNECNNAGLSCLQGACVTGACQWPDTCCGPASTCDDGKPCTLDTCSGGTCQHSAVAGCCAQASDCQDSDPCLAATCPVVGGACSFAQSPACCSKDAQCDDLKPCTQDLCALASDGTGKGTCKHKDICCQTAQDCDDGQACSVEACNAGFCAWTWKTEAGCCQPSQGDWAFESAPSVNDWKRQTCSAGNHALPTACLSAPWQMPTKGWQVLAPAPVAHGGTGVLYYGDGVAKNFAWGASAGTATSKPLIVQPGVSTLALWVYWDTEGGTSYDRLHLFLQVDGVRTPVGSNTAPTHGAFWTKGVQASQPKTWQKVSVDVSAYAGKSVAVEVYFNTVDGAGNNGLGVLIDDVALGSTCGK